MAKVVYWKPGLDCRTFSNDITQVKANAIVVGEAPDLCEESSVTKTLKEKIPLFEQRRMRLKRIYRKLELWSVKHCYLGSTFMFVIHAVMEKGSDEGWARNMRSLYHRVFREAESLRASAIALPLLGTGIAESDLGLAVSVLVASVLSYTPQGQHMSIIVVSRDGHRLDEVETQFMYQLQYPEGCQALFNGTRVTETECDQPFHGIGQQRKTLGYSGYASREELDHVLETSAREAEEREKAEGRSGKAQGNQIKDVEIDTRPDIQRHRNSALITAIEKSPKRETTKPISTAAAAAAPASGLRVDDTIEVDELFSLETMSLEPTRFGNQGVATSEFLEYNRQLQRVREVAMKNGYTMKETVFGRDLFTALSEQLSYVLRVETDQGQLRTMLAPYLRRCQSNNDKSLQMFLKGKSMDEVRTAVEKGDDVEIDVLLSAVSDALNVEVLLLAPSGDEKRYQPSKEKEFLPTLALITVPEKDFISLEHVEGVIPRDIPETWSRSSKGTELVTLQEESKEFQEVQQSFLATIGWFGNRRVIQEISL